MWYLTLDSNKALDLHWMGLLRIEAVILNWRGSAWIYLLQLLLVEMIWRRWRFLMVLQTIHIVCMWILVKLIAKRGLFRLNYLMGVGVAYVWLDLLASHHLHAIGINKGHTWLPKLIHIILLTWTQEQVPILLLFLLDVFLLVDIGELVRWDDGILNGRPPALLRAEHFPNAIVIL